MKLWRQSFRFRIMAMTIGVTGIVLLAFGLESRYALYLIKISTVDQSLRTLPFREFPHPQHQRGWERFSQLTEQVANRVFNGDVHILVYGKNDEMYYKTDYWTGRNFLQKAPEVEGVLTPPPTSEPDLEREYWRMGRRGRIGDSASGETMTEGAGEGAARREIRGGPRPAMRGLHPIGPPDLMTIKTSIGPMRFGVYKFDGYNVAMGVELSKVAQEMTHVRNAFLVSAPLALAIIAVGAWIISSRAIRPVRRLTEAASGMSVSRLDERIPQEREDQEFSELVRVFNGMLERLERSFNQATRFSADAAHELKTPLTILQGHLESALQEAPDDSDQQRRLGMLLEEAQRLRGITRRLLILAQADAGQIAVNKTPTRFRETLEELVEDFQMQSPEMRFSLEVALEDPIDIDPALVTQILQNLLSNAVKYNDDRSPWVSIDVVSDEKELRLEIANGGEGIPTESQGRLFERFSRVDSARNRSVDGFGLGLNLSREFAAAHGGALTLVDSKPGETRFRLILPIKD